MSGTTRRRRLWLTISFFVCVTAYLIYGIDSIRSIRNSPYRSGVLAKRQPLARDSAASMIARVDRFREAHSDSPVEVDCASVGEGRVREFLDEAIGVKVTRECRTLPGPGIPDDMIMFIEWYDPPQMMFYVCYVSGECRGSRDVRSIIAKDNRGREALGLEPIDSEARVSRLPGQDD